MEQCRQGEVDKNRSVNSGKGLALRFGHGCPNLKLIGHQRTAQAACAARAAKGAGLTESVGKEDPIELESSPTL
ncbi:hypothetical protein HPP92_016612 [Vanilla planifolia]|uniref:Uncharacterized protein n=1 Tax=Vanilla planifolia TaxID=51239 RepID=A0A835UQ57_VANPL|nr:hypothetical protein HPP92_016612 [Vanilla planifolia]